jgi:hypothetical protein
MSSATLSHTELTVAISVDSSVTRLSLFVTELSLFTDTISAKEGPYGAFLFVELVLGLGESGTGTGDKSRERAAKRVALGFFLGDSCLSISVTENGFGIVTSI